MRELNLDAPVCRGVLLVDDEFEVLAVLEALLDDDWDVHTAQSGSAALDILNSEQNIQLVITDQRMPEMTGVEFLQAVADSHPDLYRMVLTAYSDVDPIVAAINQGKVDQFILKPWDPVRIRALVAEGLAVCERRSSMRNVVAELTNRFQEKNSELSQLKDHAERAKANAWLHTLEHLGTTVLDALQPILTNVQMTCSETPSIRESAQRMRGLSEDIRRLGSTERETERRSIAPRKLVSDAVRLLVDDEIGQQNPIHVDIKPELDSLNILPEPTRQALLNMLRNAIRASPPESPIQVKVRPEPHAMLVIEVIDGGTGMTDDQMQEATTPFYSGFEPPGNGLGLTLVRLVAELHSGRIAMLGNEPEGTICQLWIPKGVA